MFCYIQLIRCQLTSLIPTDPNPLSPDLKSMGKKIATEGYHPFTRSATFSKKEQHFLPTATQRYVCISRGNKCWVCAYQGVRNVGFVHIKGQEMSVLCISRGKKCWFCAYQGARNVGFVHIKG